MGVAAMRSTVTDYRRLVAAGVLAPDERVELIEAQLFQRAPHIAPP
jgi:hypothetical protein